MLWNNYLFIIVFLFTAILVLLVYFKNPRKKSNPIIAHQLFNIRIITKKIFIYSILLALALTVYVAIVLGFTIFIGAENRSFYLRDFIPNIVATIAIAFGFEPIRRKLEKITDKFSFVGQYDLGEVTRQLGVSLASSTSLSEALRSMMEALIKAMRLEFSIFFILNNEQNEAKNNRIEVIGAPKEKLVEPFSEKLATYFKALQEPIIREELERDIRENKKIKEVAKGKAAIFMRSISVAMALPVFIKGKLIGIMMMPEKKSGDVFSAQDWRLVSIVLLQTVSIIERKHLCEEDQMKSEFVSIASHELLTPTAVIEGYLSMILDENFVKVDPVVQKYLTRAYASSQRLSRLVKRA